MFAPSSAELVYSRHMLEHLDPDDGRRTLRAWFDLLQPGVVLNVIVPDILFRREDAHRWDYSEPSLTLELTQAGFEDIQRVTQGVDSEPWHLNLTCRKQFG